MSSAKSTRALIGLVVVLALAGAFWMLVLSPKRKESSELQTQVTQLQQGLAEAQARSSEALLAKKAFPSDYRQLVVLGKAVPEGPETASLLVSMNRIAAHAKVSFNSLDLQATESVGEATPTAQQVGPTAPAPQPVPPTEAEAALLPLGATVGSANLGVMPYSMNFTGGFFEIANFIESVESQIKTTKKATLLVDGRLFTIDGFSLVGSEEGSSTLTAEFNVSSFVVPPSQGLTAGAGEAAPEFGVAPEAGVQESAPAAAEAANSTPSSYETGAEGEAR